MKIKCEYCNKEYNNIPSKIAKNKHNFCSKLCYKKWLFDKNNLIGQKFGRLTVIEFKYIKNGGRYYLCQCECGNEKIIRANSLKQGTTKSCGCYHNEVAKINCNQTTHNKTNSRIYRIWTGIKTRCTNKNIKEYKYYGARNIKICDEWKNSFEIFYEWAMTNGYKDDLTIDRIDVNGDYCPENCRWLPMKKQTRNTRKNKYITYNGQTYCIAEWAEILNINYNILWRKLNKQNLSIEEVFRGH